MPIVLDYLVILIVSHDPKILAHLINLDNPPDLIVQETTQNEKLLVILLDVSLSVSLLYLYQRIVC